MNNEIKTTKKPLAPDERDRLATLETRIGEGMATFVAVGAALAEIREARLYRATGETFEDYCRDRWQFSGRHAERLMSAAQVVSDLSEATPEKPDQMVGSIVPAPVPQSEAVARAIASAPREKRPEVWREAVASAPRDATGKATPPTAKHVASVVARHTPRVAPPARRILPTMPWQLAESVLELVRLGEREGVGMVSGQRRHVDPPSIWKRNVQMCAREIMDELAKLYAPIELDIPDEIAA